MSRLEAFRAVRYDPDRVRADDVVAPPYDVVSPTERAILAARSEYNAIRVELPEPDPGLRRDRYSSAARLFRSWIADGVCRVEQAPSVSVLTMSFTDELGRDRSTTGVIAALGLDLEGSGEVLPHEQTIPKDREDRLSLLQATQANLSPIWGLSLASGLTAACRQARDTAAGPPWRAVDDEGVTHEAWAVTDNAAISAICELASRAPVVIADGHHRYETACAYARDQRGRAGGAPGPYDLVMALLVELDGAELSVRAIHRIVSGLDPTELEQALAQWFEIEQVPAGSTVQAMLAAMAASSRLGLVTAAGGSLLRPRPSLIQLAEDDLDSSLLRSALAATPGVQISYEPDPERAAADAEVSPERAAVLLNPVTVPQIARVAHGGTRMQPKSTYFFPKPRTGMVFRTLDPG